MAGIESDQSLVLGKAPEDIIHIAKQEVKPWLNYVNMTTGLLAFCAAMACAFSAYPKSLSFLCLVLIIALRKIALSFRPFAVNELREKPHKSELERVVLKGIESELMGRRKSITEAPAFWIGLATLFAMMLGVPDTLTDVLRSIHL